MLYVKAPSSVHSGRLLSPGQRRAGGGRLSSIPGVSRPFREGWQPQWGIIRVNLFRFRNISSLQGAISFFKVALMRFGTKAHLALELFFAFGAFCASNYFFIVATIIISTYVKSAIGKGDVNLERIIRLS